MGRMERFVVSLIALAAADLGGTAFADTEIFSVKTTAPGIAVEKAFQNGEELVLVGHGDGSSLFRIDSSTAPVPCTNHIVFVTNDQQKVDFAADFCVLNWALTLDVKTAATPPPPAAPAPAPPAPRRHQLRPLRHPAGRAGSPAAGCRANRTASVAAPAVAAPAPGPAATVPKQTVTIKTDDPMITVKEVTLDRQPVKISGMDKNAVKIEVAGGAQGVKCQRYLGVVLSNGRSIARPTNICANNGNVVVALGAAGNGPAAPWGTPSRVVTAAPPATLGEAGPAQCECRRQSTAGWSGRAGRRPAADGDAAGAGSTCRVAREPDGVGPGRSGCADHPGLWRQGRRVDRTGGRLPERHLAGEGLAVARGPEP